MVAMGRQGEPRMRRIRVLIVDDASTVRRLVSDALSPDPDLEVVGTAANGRIALDRIPQLKPDVVLLDLEMPVMGGLETLVDVRRSHPGLPVIVFTSSSGHGADVLLDALWLGATDYVIKSEATSLDEAIAHIRCELVPRIKEACAAVLLAPPDGRAPAREPASPRRGAPAAIELLAIGASTGGPEAITAVLGGLPQDFPVPIVIAQHMPRLFTQFFASRLAARTSLPVTEASDGDVLSPGRVWLAPGDWHMTLARAGRELCVHLDQGPPINSCRPSIDTLFLSAAEVCGPCVLGVILTGMGQDGLRGAERIRGQHGRVLVQDEASSVVWGMPGIVARAGLAEAVVPLDQIATEILRRVGARRAWRNAAA